MWGGVTSDVNASWLSKQLKKLDNALGSSSSESMSTSSAPTSMRRHWVQVSENPYFRTYVDKNSLKADGSAQYRSVTAVFKSEFTPIGSEWIAEDGEVKPNVITHHYYTAKYGVNLWAVDNTMVSHPDEIRSTYFDVHNHLIYEGRLDDLEYLYNNVNATTFKRPYTPDSESEHIRDVLFSYFGWNY